VAVVRHVLSHGVFGSGIQRVRLVFGEILGEISIFGEFLCKAGICVGVDVGKAFRNGSVLYRVGCRCDVTFLGGLGFWVFFICFFARV
jgi:hypothetical protein